MDDALQRAAGRADAVRRATERADRAGGARYIDWLVPGLLGMNIMGTGMWGVGFAIVQARTRKLLKRLVATPMRRRDYLLVARARRGWCSSSLEVGVLLGFAVAGLRRRRCGGSLRGAGAWCALLGALAFGGLGLLVASRARTIEARVGPDEPGDAADVGALGRVLLVRALPGA